MKNSFYPVLLCNDILKEANFFIDLFDFQEVFHSDWYISLKDNEGFELAMIESSHDTIPEPYRKKYGVILNIEVDDVDDVYAKVISRNNVPLLSEIKNEDYGQSHFIIGTPGNMMIDVIQITEPSEEFLKNYQETGK